MGEIIILGAGMVGVATALAFQERGHDVIVVDRTEPGRETSYGNAGVIQVEAAEPYALPYDLPTLFRMASGLTNDVTWSLAGLTKMAPALFSYFLNSSSGRHSEISRIYAGLTARATSDHAPLIEAANAQNMISREGLALLFRDARAFDDAVKDAERVQTLYGRTYRVLDGAKYRMEEPALLATPAGAVHWDQGWSCSNPGGLTEAYAQLFARRGGQFAHGDAATLRQTATGWSVDTVEGPLAASDVVVALGPWSPELLKRFGYRIPMVYKRGYHGHFESGIPLRRPFLDVANGVVAASMQKGLRISTGAAIVPQTAPSDPRQLERGRAGLGDLLQIGARIDEPQWFGTRPCMPDMLPLTGPAPRHKRLWFNFGHGHQGFTLGPTTGALLADAYDLDNLDLLAGLAPAQRRFF